MTISSNRVFKSVALVVLLTALAGCLPQSGPNKTEILKNTEFYRSTEEVETIPAYVVNVDERVIRSMPPAPDFVFPDHFISESPEKPNLIRPGDSLSFTVYENVDNGIFASGPGGASVGALQVDEGGFVFIPYAGRIRAAGNTSERLRRIVTNQLAENTPQPQVVVRRSEGDGGSVYVLGNGIGQGIFPIGRSNLRLVGMLAAAGGVAGDPGVVDVIVIRGEERAQMRYEDIYDDPKYDIALRPGDKVIVERDTRTFIALGQTGGQGRIPFTKQNLSALDALAQVGGLNGGSADPTGIFVIRDEAAEVVNIMLDRADFTTEQRMIYVLNLTAPSGIFHARNFNIKDGDTVYVTEAPFRQFTKVLNAITGTAFTVRNLTTLPTTP